MDGVVIITGSTGLIGSASARIFHEQGVRVVGIDDDTRATLFGPMASTAPLRPLLEQRLERYRHVASDVRNAAAMEELFAEYSSDIVAVVHCAGQPSHDWAASAPLTDFDINARATLILLDLTRRFAPEASFLFCSTNKVYGDRPNRLAVIDQGQRFDLPAEHPCFDGVGEEMEIDATTHSLFGVSKTAADLAVQEYGRYFGLRTACFRAGCITGRHHSAVRLHGFLAYLVRCVVTTGRYEVIGYGGKQVRDNLHASDLASMFLEFVRNPRVAAVYNVGGGRERSCSILEAIAMVERVSGRRARLEHTSVPRLGDHRWYISNTGRFRNDYPDWRPSHSLLDMVTELVEAPAEQLGA